jgi:flagellar P-ring protein precursor FlgI
MSARLAGWLLGALLIAPVAQAQTRVADLTRHAGEVPRRLVGYGLVTGLGGSGDQSFGGYNRNQTITVRSVVNLLRRFHIEVPPEQLRLRDVAAVLVTAEVSPFLRAGGRFDVQVSALGDATSLRGGVLWITPLLTDPDQPPVATAQGSLLLAGDESGRTFYDPRANSGRLLGGGVLEVDPPALALQPRLIVREPDLATATRIAEAVNGAFGKGTAKVDDPGALSLVPPASTDVGALLAAVDTLRVELRSPARVVIDGRAGTIVAGGDVRVSAAAVSHHGITLQVGGAADRGQPVQGLVRMAPQASVQDVAAGLHAAGARPEEIAAIFESLHAAGALVAEVVVR